MKKSGFRFFSNLLVFAANQTWQLVNKNVNAKRYVFDVIVQQVRLLSKWLVEVEGAVCSMQVINPKKYLTIQLC